MPLQTTEHMDLLLVFQFPLVLARLLNERKRPFNKLLQADLKRTAVGVQGCYGWIVLVAYPFAHADGVHIEGRHLLQLS